MGAAESKTDGSRGVEITSTVPAAKEELITWKIENLSTLMEMSKIKIEPAQSFSAKYNFEIEAEKGVGLTEWCLFFKPLTTSKEDYYSLGLQRVSHTDDDSSSKKWFQDDVYVKMELLPESKFPWTLPCCLPRDDIFNAKDKTPQNAQIPNNSRNQTVGWEKFVRVESIFLPPSHSSICRNYVEHLPKSTEEEISLSICLKITFKYNIVTTICKQLPSHDPLLQESVVEFKKFLEAMFKKFVKIQKIKPSMESLSAANNVALYMVKSEKYIISQKCFLVERSDYFKKMFETNTAEKQTNMVTIDDIGVETMMLVLEYIYTGNLPMAGTAKDAWTKNPRDVVLAADQYQLLILKQFCEKHLPEVCTKANAKELYELAKSHKFENSKRSIWEFIQKNLDPDTII